MGARLIDFGPFQFDRDTGTLCRHGVLVPLGGRGSALLTALLEAENAVVSKQTLLDHAWKGAVVEETNLPVQIAALRKILGQRDDGSEWIVTLARTGYRLARDMAGEGLPAIAVLPFVAMDDVGSFADGFVEDLITALSRFKTFAVAARVSTEPFRGGGDARQIARELGVRYLVEGSVRRTGDHVRLTAQLIDGVSGMHLWSERMDSDLDGIFDVQDRLVAGVVGVFEPHIRHAEIGRARRKRPESLDAYDLYLRALPLLKGVRDFRLDHFDQAIALLDRAIALDPAFAPALALCAAAHELRLTNGGIAPPGTNDRDEAFDLIERALQQDQSDAMVLAQAGALHVVLGGDERRGFALLAQAETLNPNSLLIANISAYCFWQVGDVEASITKHMRALRLAPSVPEAAWAMNGLARSLLSAGRADEALHWGLRALERTEALDSAHCVVAAAYAHLGQQANAEARIRRALVIWPKLSVRSLISYKTAPRARFRLLEEGLLRAGLPAA
jgi:TolB-like protein/Flp pilus assembly protein TadD